MIIGCSFIARAQQNDILRHKNIREKLKHQVNISPNPCRGTTQITLPEGASCLLLSGNGQIIGNWVISNNKLTLENLTEGFYWVVIKHENQVVRKKIMVL